MVEMQDIYDANGKKTGRLHERGKSMQASDYYLCVHVWIMNSNSEFLRSCLVSAKNKRN